MTGPDPRRPPYSQVSKPSPYRPGSVDPTATTRSGPRASCRGPTVIGTWPLESRGHPSEALGIDRKSTGIGRRVARRSPVGIGLRAVSCAPGSNGTKTGVDVVWGIVLFSPCHFDICHFARMAWFCKGSSNHMAVRLLNRIMLQKSPVPSSHME